MGCWQETCALTHLPIYAGDKCVVVVMDEIFTELFEKNPDLGLFKSHEHFKYVDAIHYGTYDDYGWIKQVENVMAPDDQGVNRPFSQRRITVFFHEYVWRKAVKAGMKKAREWEKLQLDEIESFKTNWAKISQKPFEESIYAETRCIPPTPNQVEFRAVYEVAFWTRRDLRVSHFFHGCQSWENHYYDLVHDLTSKMWAKTKKRFEED